MENLFLTDDANPVLLTGSAAQRTQAAEAAARSAYEAGCPVFVTDCGGQMASLPDVGYACTLWDIYARAGLPLRTTVSELGPDLLAALMDLSDAQADLLQILIRIADAQGLLLIDTKDLRALIGEVTDHRDTYEKQYGTINPRTASGLLSALTLLEERGGADYLFEPAIDVRDFIGEGVIVTEARDQREGTDLPAAAAEQCEGAALASPVGESGPGEARVGGGSPRIHILDARDVTQDASLYAVFLLYLISECAENYPEAEESGETVTPALTMVLDEAPLLFSGSTRAFAGRLRRLTDQLGAKGVRLILLASDAKKLPEEARDLLRQMPIADLALPEARTGAKSPSDSRRLSMTADDPLHEKYKIPFDRDSAYEFLLRRGVPEEEAAAAAEDSQDTAGQAAAQAADETAAEDVSALDAAAGAQPADGAAAEDAAAAQPAAGSGAADSAADAMSAEAATDDTSEEASDSSSKDTSDLLKKAKSSVQSLGNTVAGTVGRQIGKTIGSNFGSFGSTLGGNVGASIGRGIMKTFFSD